VAAAARSVYVCSGREGRKEGFSVERGGGGCVVAAVRGWRVFILFWSRFLKKNLFSKKKRRTVEVGEVGRGLAKPVQRNDHGVCGVHRPVRKRGNRERERERRKGEERRGERGAFFLQSSELECFNWHMLWDFACFGAVFPFSMPW